MRIIFCSMAVADDIDEKTIAMLAEVAGVSSDEYKSTTIKKNTDKHNAELSANELKIVELFRLLNGEGQEKLIDYADDLVQSQKYIKKVIRLKWGKLHRTGNAT